MSAPIKRILSEFTKLEGVKGAIVVGKDGMVIDAVAPSKDFDPEDLGASMTQAVRSLEKIGQAFDLGSPRILSQEYDNGMIVVGDLGESFILVIADKMAMVGMIRNEIKKLRDKLKALI
ncbi:MAG: roadblock/LC7 domain-containing protein [Desulfurococcales archaeon]|nr:roadblock/LC7 domain-containing protein [Desulfurococcales archaeon]